MIRIISAFFFAVLLFLSNSSPAQITITYSEKIPDIRKSITYIVMKNSETEAALPFVQIFKEYWTISKIEFIPYADIQSHVEAGVSFFNFNAVYTENDGVVRSSIFMELQHVEGIPGKSDINVYPVARIEIMADTINSPENHKYIRRMEYSGEGHFYNWGPGILKNYLQQLMVLLEEGKDFKPHFQKQLNPVLLKELKSKTLYIPRYAFLKYPTLNTDKYSEEELLAYYPYSTERIETGDLNEKILASDEPVYYLIMTIKLSFKQLSIIRSDTGEVIYYENEERSVHLKPTDFKKLAKKIETLN